MKDINNVYYNLTGVNINEQKILWDERGKGYYGEFMVFERLYKNIPGVSKILMNINVPVSGNKTTEIDLLMIHETGLMTPMFDGIYDMLDGRMVEMYYMGPMQCKYNETRKCDSCGKCIAEKWEKE